MVQHKSRENRHATGGRLKREEGFVSFKKISRDKSTEGGEGDFFLWKKRAACLVFEGWQIEGREQREEAEKGEGLPFCEEKQTEIVSKKKSKKGKKRK